MNGEIGCIDSKLPGRDTGVGVLFNLQFLDECVGDFIFLFMEAIKKTGSTVTSTSVYGHKGRDNTAGEEVKGLIV